MIEVFADKKALSRGAAKKFLQIAQEAVAKNGRFLVALSGGSTPQGLFRQLSQPPFNDLLPWQQTHVFWGDERLVPPDDAGSNYKQAHDVLLSKVNIPPQQIYRALGEATPATAVTDYTNKLKGLAEPNREWPQFDLILLGMGSDGHTASLFPGPIPTIEKTNAIITVTAEYDGRPAHRITFTPLVINDARHVIFLVVGENKREALTAVRLGSSNPEKWPAQRVQPHPGSLTWLVDAAAAGNFEK